MSKIPQVYRKNTEIYIIGNYTAKKKSWDGCLKII